LIFPPQHQSVDKGHGRIETRQVWTSAELNDYIDFPGLQQVFAIRREVFHIKKNKTTEEVAYGLTSLESKKADPCRVLALNRGQWSIENRLHYVRDVTFEEDGSTIRTRNAPRVMASLRNLVISIFHIVGIDSIPEARRNFAAKPHLALRLIGF
jgi:hypothetical protein